MAMTKGLAKLSGGCDGRRGQKGVKGMQQADGAEKTYFPFIDWLKAVAILAVVLLHCLPGENAALTGRSVYFAQLIHGCCNFAVPVFVMVTGAVLLNREESLRKTLRRTARLALALLIFGWAAAFLEAYFQSRALAASMGQAVLRLLGGESWSFTWFLYMMIGVYLMLPLFRIFVKNATDAALIYVMAALFVFNSIIPAINGLAGRTVLDFSLPVGSVYALYLLLGYYFQHRLRQAPPAWLCVGGICLCIAVFAVLMPGNSVAEFETLGWLAGYAPPAAAVLACAVFLLAKLVNTAGAGIRIIAQNSFGIYLIHCFYINASRYLLRLPEGLAITPPLFICVFSLALASSAALRKIRPVRKYLM